MRAQRALYFPNIQGTSLASRKTVHTTDLFKGRVSVVTVLTARVSEVRRCMLVWDLQGLIRRSQEHANSFVADVLEDWEEDPMFRYVQVRLSLPSLLPTSVQC
jgi:ATPase complex subunit ATP10